MYGIAGWLREGETGVPAGIQKAFEESRKVRELVKKNVKSGKTGREQLDNLKRLVAEAGYVLFSKLSFQGM